MIYLPCEKGVALYFADPGNQCLPDVYQSHAVDLC